MGIAHRVEKIAARRTDGLAPTIGARIVELDEPAIETDLPQMSDNGIYHATGIDRRAKAFARAVVR